MSLESLPVGLRFRPTDEELINHYLWGKINGHESAVKVIAEIDLCKWEPWDLPNLAEKSVTRPDDSEWFFFALVDRKYPTGNRSNRATTAGYWKATGKDRMIKSGKKSIGSKKTLVFHIGRAPDGERTTWIMHEYRTNENSTDCMISGQPAYVLCRIFYKPDEKKSSNSNSKEMDQISFSPSTTKSSPDNSAHHAEDVEEQFQNTTSNQPTPDSNMIENPQILPDPTGNQPEAFAWMQEVEFYGSTSVPLVTEEKEGYSISEEMRLLIDGPRNERLDLLSQIHTGIGPSHMDLSSYNDHKDIHMGQPLGVTMEQDLYPDPHVTEFLNDEGFINHDEYLCIRPYETGACLKGGHNEGTNSGSLPSVGLDVSSVTSTETTHNLVNIAEESTDRKNPASSSNDHELTGARQPQNPTISQGFAPRRLRLQTKIQMGSLAFKGAKPSRDETENEAKSAIKEALEDFKDNPTAGTRLPGLVDADQLGNFDNHGGSLVNQQCNLTLRLRTNRNDEMHRKQEGLSQLPEASNARIPYVSTVYVALCITVLLIVFVGVWGGMLLS